MSQPSYAAAHVHLFVYGTLRSGTGERAAELLRGSTRVGAASVSGTLYDMDGAYPALVLAGKTPVRGEIWRCAADRLTKLDDYEGVADGLFRRVAVRVDGFACWTYVAGPALAQQLTPARRVRSGRWPRDAAR